MKKEWIPYPRFLLRKDLIKKILKHENVKDKSCLEIGYGSGYILAMCADFGLYCYGYDFSPHARLVAQRNILLNNDLHKRIVLFNNEAEMFQKKYDFVLAFEVLEHIENDNEAILKWIQLLKNGGKLILSVPAHKKRFNALDLSVGHYRRYDKDDFTHLITNNNLAIEHIYSYGFPVTNITEFVSAIIVWFNRKSHNTQTKEVLTQKSFEGKTSFFIRFISNNFVLSPFYLIQSFFIKSNLGTGYIVCTKRTEHG